MESRSSHDTMNCRITKLFVSRWTISRTTAQNVIEVSHNDPKESCITFIARRRISSASWIVWLSSSVEPGIGWRLLWSWYAWRAWSCFYPSSFSIVGWIWDRSTSTASMSWLIWWNSWRRASRLVSKLSLVFCRPALVLCSKLISSRVESMRPLRLSLYLVNCSCWRRSEIHFWALRTCIRRLSIFAAGIKASSIGSGSWPSRDFKMRRIGSTYQTS